MCDSKDNIDGVTCMDVGMDVNVGGLTLNSLVSNNKIPTLCPFILYGGGEKRGLVTGRTSGRETLTRKNISNLWQ